VSGTGTSVGQLVDAIGAFAPWHWAAPWDQVGLLVGDADAIASRVLVTLDPSAETVARAAAGGVNVIVSHHPVFLAPPARFVRGSGGVGAVVASALNAGISLVAAHTNLDRHPDASNALASLLGVSSCGSLESSLATVSLVVTYVPAEAADRVRSAMGDAGAGRVGSYKDSSFSHDGHGRFVAGELSHPVNGVMGANTVAEVCIEMTCPVPFTTRVLSAARDAHPYESPVVFASEVQMSRVGFGLGCVCPIDPPTDLATLASDIAARTGVAPRVWGDPDAPMRTAAVATGSAGSLIGDSIAVGADVLIGGEVRYHDAMEARDDGLSIIELGHDVSEWPLVPLLGAAVATTPGLRYESIDIDTPSIRWWTA
jgi:dinuclear metal center YbgI/SA1388 family protein